MTVSTTDGQFLCMTRREYNRHPGVRSTAMRDLLSPQGPALYYQKHVLPQPKREWPPKVDDFQIGILLHSLLLEHREDWYVAKERRGTKAWRDEFDEHEGDGKIPVTQTVHDQLHGMAEAVLRNPEAKELVRGAGVPERAFVWTHQKTGIQAKTLVDFFRYDGIVADLKTWHPKAGRVTREGWDRHQRDMMYPFQAAFQLQGIRSVAEFKDLVIPYKHVVVVKEEPYWCYVWPLGDGYLRIGNRDVETAFERLKHCLDTDHWPDLLEVHQDNPLEPPDWYLTKKGFQPDDW